MLMAGHSFCTPAKANLCVTVIPAYAGIQGWGWVTCNDRLCRGTLYSRFRGNDGGGDWLFS